MQLNLHSARKKGFNSLVGGMCLWMLQATGSGVLKVGEGSWIQCWHTEPGWGPARLQQLPCQPLRCWNPAFPVPWHFLSPSLQSWPIPRGVIPQPLGGCRPMSRQSREIKHYVIGTWVLQNRVGKSPCQLQGGTLKETEDQRLRSWGTRRNCLRQAEGFQGSE